MNKDALEILNDILGDEELTSGNILRQRRKTLDLTQIELAEITGLKQENISAYENDKMNIGKDVAEVFAAALSLSPLTILYPRGFFLKERKHIRIALKAKKIMHKKLKYA